jgi:hypothetical protein
MKTLETISERVYKAGYVLRTEIVETLIEDNPTMEWVFAYTPSGDRIGDSKAAYELCVNLGITPEKASPEHTVCSIGFSSKDGKWYGWSHRAIYGFKIGSKCRRGDCHYRAASRKDYRDECKRFWASDSHENVKARYVNDRDGLSGIEVSWTYSDDIPNEKLRGQISSVFEEYPETWGKGEWRANTVADARQMACDFADSVS